MANQSPTTSDEAILKATGKSWNAWLKVFEAMNAKHHSHKDIAARLYERHKVPGWWAQMLTVKYEQEIGRRVKGQTCEGDFSVSVNTTVDGTMDDALALWQDIFGDKKELGRVKRKETPRVSSTEKWRYWKVDLEDETSVNVNFYNKSAAKAAIQIEHRKLNNAEEVELWRAFWKNEVSQIKK